MIMRRLLIVINRIPMGVGGALLFVIFLFSYLIIFDIYKFFFKQLSMLVSVFWPCRYVVAVDFWLINAGKNRRLYYLRMALRRPNIKSN